MEYHPDRTLRHSKNVNTEVQQIWDDIRGQDDLTDDYSFKEAFIALLEQTDPKRIEVEERAVEEINRAKLAGRDRRTVIYTNPVIVEFALRMKAPYQIVTNFIIEQLRSSSYGKLLTDPRYRLICMTEDKLFSTENAEALNTDRVLRHAVKNYCLCGKKLYTVSPGLSWQMRHIQLRNMPEEFLQAPYPAFYLTCPAQNPFKIFNNETGWHNVEGMYVMEDSFTKPRAWQMILTAGGNDRSVNEADDSLYHYIILLPLGKTLDECVTYSLEEAWKSGGLKRIADNIEIASGEMGDSTRDVFEKSKSELVAAFKYAVNIVLYATHPDAEQEVFNASPEFQALYKRARKAKGKKRKDLFARARTVKGDDRILLGGSVIVSREEREALAAPKRKGTKHKVRSYVAAHWQHYYKGPMDGERERVYLLKKAYWKGAKALPVSTTSRTVK